ncbi:DUF2161 family putative PD-(D/E)XK-type phosphodiesterase [Motilimonas pumila]|uniref:DUF2161 domain-containing phosphodiesterase n=1 Tax=Motilimonas pumila TaxID=2303987 RepID=A0A418YBM6_9GAMM|nr:DUF2161 family putative PD-(D/E)XK-type phosphodiesterase [Motilimonas pumila]RJG41920.1 hypothetical protein D1Z90_15620 [Motilimonas pumila]
MAVKRPETDLYLPVKHMLEQQGFTVKGEVKQCDIFALKEQGDQGDALSLVVELKTTVNLTLILQAVERMAVADNVYIAVPADCAPIKKQQKSIVKLVRRLGIGLIVVAFVGQQTFVETVASPGDYQPRKNLKKSRLILNEFHQRDGDPEVGGAASRGKKMTVYRQRCINVARYLAQAGATKASVVALEVDDPKARYLLSTNVYKWFERVSQGVYQLSAHGHEELQLWLS